MVFEKEPRGNDHVEDFDEESESESDSDDDVKLTEPRENSIYNRDGLLDKLGDISWPENVDWIHSLSVDIHLEQEVDVNDDLTREAAFYTQALEGTRQAFQKLESVGRPFLRPPDYHAEMVKTDNHMGEVKDKLLAEKKNIEEADERKKAKESEKLSKEVQAEKQKERAKQKKDDIKSVKKLRKQREKSGFPEVDKDEGMDLPFEDGKTFLRPGKKEKGAAPGDRSGGKMEEGGKDKNKKKREVKDSKFGHGGRKGLKKQNTAETTNDFKGFNKGDVAKNKRRKK